MRHIQFENEESFSSDFNIVTSSKGTIVIDAGFYNDEIKLCLKQIGKIDAILLTHGHWDHIQSLDEIKKDFPEVKIYIHEKDYEFLENPSWNLSLKHGFDLKVQSEAEKLKEGKFKVGDYEIELIHTPGHTGGSCLYYLKEENLLFTGDTIGPKVIGNSYYPTGSEEDMFQSLEKFKNLNLPKDTRCISSHWGSGTFEEILEMNPYLNFV
ncbi:MAG: MBL fold metallo-hydrolase [Clostridia bacterium]|nr:MBL fold metallo-hydrolase [Clostridia bacterium]